MSYQKKIDQKAPKSQFGPIIDLSKAKNQPHQRSSMHDSKSCQCSRTITTFTPIMHLQDHVSSTIGVKHYFSVWKSRFMPLSQLANQGSGYPVMLTLEQCTQLAFSGQVTFPNRPF